MKKYIKYGFASLLTTLTFVACSNVDEWEAPVSDVSLIYQQTFASGLGDFTAQSVSGNQVWANDGTYVMMTGYSNSTNYANEDWLISPEIDLTKVTAANLSFQHVVRYFTNLKDEATVWISTDYADGLPSTGTWTQLKTQPFIDYSSWNFVPSGEISLTAYAGKKVHIAFKYVSTAAKAGTWEIQNVVVKNTEAVVATSNFGAGTEASPYTVSGGLFNQSSAGWVNGTIVGYVWSGTQTSYVFGADTCTQATNILIADSAKNIYLSRTLPVQLPSGVVRDGLNLVTHKNNIGKKVKLYGDLISYFGVPGLKNVIYYEFADGTSGGSKPVFPFYSESFISSQGDFTIDNKVLPTGFTSIWLSTKYGITASGYKSGNFASESWLITPSINLASHTSVGMSFDHTINKGVMANLKTDQTLWITVDNGATWAQLTIPIYPAGNNWTFVNSGDIDLNPYLGKNIKIAFKYISSVASSASWEVKNFRIYER